MFTTTMTFLSKARALRSTNRVCGMGPSTESTRSSTPVPRREFSVYAHTLEQTAVDPDLLSVMQR